MHYKLCFFHNETSDVRCPGHTIHFLKYDYSKYTSKISEILDIDPLKVDFSKDVKKLEQEIKIDGLGTLNAKWNEKKDRTTVIEKEIGRKREKQIINGLALLFMETDNGKLSFGY